MRSYNYPKILPPTWASAYGQDNYGYWADVSIDNIIQRFRWIPKGRFSMGSPESELDREEGLFAQGKETLHEVQFSNGFWLADTACTQELWSILMGNNPADFNSDLANPVENVSWLDVQEFLISFNSHLPNPAACLPTEAQWEYTCRAGTTTPFSFGENVTPEQVNYDGKFPYGDGEVGLYRQQPVPVKALPPNQWGLYQMHGNVWEWCFDEFRKTLPLELSIDPVSAQFKGRDHRSFASNLVNAQEEDIFRILKGGSWYRKARTCRSALRDRSKARNRFNRIGFRFVMLD